MNVLITGFAEGKKIQAIKGIRQAAPLSLKEAKDVADDVQAGARVKLTLELILVGGADREPEKFLGKVKAICQQAAERGA